MSTLCYDLHSHSTASDGTLAPRDLVERAARSGVHVLALTDHDTTAGLAEAEQAAGPLGLEVVRGVEVSVTWGGRTVHILGLNVARDCVALEDGLARLRVEREGRARRIAALLEEAGIPGAYEGARALAKGSILSRTHFAHFLVAEGVAESVRDVFKKYLINGKPGHVSGEWAGLAEAVGWIRAAGGQAVIAHPARYGFTAAKLGRLVAEFQEAGGRGLEVVSGSHAPEDNDRMATVARRHGLLASSGSDFHGPENPWRELGAMPRLPADLRPVWADWGGQAA
ncbi:MAG: PHP domain-containing protein [Gammaproteobacteria bacterium]|nr:PHP domain-containing protein [Gammaproteobacteria bacterium]